MCSNSLNCASFRFCGLFLRLDLVIHHPKSLLDAMRPWYMEHYTKSGLDQQVLDYKLSMLDIGTEIINCIEQVTSLSINKKFLILTGKSVYVDRYFLEKKYFTFKFFT
ncbi:unnamed protein product [Rotaria sp. Silwood2]|nr:unnamed protein product [Rotaria sp. Silwood2]CAF3371023.1 unnamed protein product [Rotaria sp. Silwood2]CAF4222818.1 unnamed protein product [Rotaria sp. Silwood2]CAF4289047.1 unnamed protein product [Rotaria sp. Silwood2]